MAAAFQRQGTQVRTNNLLQLLAARHQGVVQMTGYFLRLGREWAQALEQEEALAAVC
jgi:hypothetical protein